ncbi:MAG: helix-turn-helix domain-containing protein [Gammaproteobacteria bacterium]|nr:helix-turn-helix domain-containing protein [Gammaproteobacteria bacterium]
MAEKLETSIAYLSQLAHGHRKPGARILARIESATGGQVTPADMRPDLFAAPKLRARKVG